jgi:hypothetical protein
MKCPLCGQESRIDADDLTCEKCGMSWPCPRCGKPDLVIVGAPEQGMLACQSCNNMFNARVGEQ